MGHAVLGERTTGRLCGVQGLAGEPQQVQVMRRKLIVGGHLSPPRAHGIREVSRWRWS